MATAMASLLTGQPVRRDLAMTGEITLRGRVLPIGGLKSKLLAAHLAGVKTVLIPKRNEKDLVDVPQEIRDQLRIVPVDTMDEVLAEALIDAGASGGAHQGRAGCSPEAGRSAPPRRKQEEEAPVAATPKPQGGAAAGRASPSARVGSAG